MAKVSELSHQACGWAKMEAERKRGCGRLGALVVGLLWSRRAQAVAVGRAACGAPRQKGTPKGTCETTRLGAPAFVGGSKAFPTACLPGCNSAALRWVRALALSKWSAPWRSVCGGGWTSLTIFIPADLLGFNSLCRSCLIKSLYSLGIVHRLKSRLLIRQAKSFII